MFPSNHYTTFILADTGDCHGRNTTVRLHLYSAIFRAQLDLVLADLLHVSFLSSHDAEIFFAQMIKLVDTDHFYRLNIFLIYFRYGFLFLVFIILIITCSETTILLCYFHLCAEVNLLILHFYNDIWNWSYTLLNPKRNNSIPQHSRIIIGGGEVSWPVDSRHSTCLSTVSITLQPN